MALTVNAQEAQMKFGYLSYKTVLDQMPEVAQARQDMTALRAKYDEEAKRVEEDFNKKYEDFLEGQKSFPQNILLKRQTELKEMMEKNIEFKNESRRLLQQAEREQMDKAQAKLQEAIAQVAKAHGLAFVLNTDANACPYIDAAQGVDIAAEVVSRLK